MKNQPSGLSLSAILLATTLAAGFSAIAQPAPATNAAPARGRGPQTPQVKSPELSADRRVTFRIYAPKADAIRVVAGDIPGNGSGAEMVKGTNGVWEVTVGPIIPGAYRYNFNINGVSVIDPANPATSESNNNTWSLVVVPGAPLMDVSGAPHGAVAEVTYYSSSLKRFRRMHVYTPPGYELGKGKFPTFYLLHGAGDSDDSWSSVGRAGFILDNLIATKKAKPMVVVMPAGHTRAGGFGPRPAGTPAPPDEFLQDFLVDIMPFVESHYRVHKDRKSRAIAGLSMGGSQTLNIALPNLDRFAYVGVFSSGLIGSFGGGRGGTNAPAATGPSWEERHKAELDNPKWKKGLELLWFSTGKDDFLVRTTTGTVEMLKKHGFNPIYQESDGGHTWINWRNYLSAFTPQLFR